MRHVSTMYYHGTVELFRVAMERLAVLYGRPIPPTTERMISYFEDHNRHTDRSTRGSWHVVVTEGAPPEFTNGRISGPGRILRGCIEAFSDPAGTRLEFLDGCAPPFHWEECPEIGPDFDAFIQRMAGELGLSPAPQGKQQQPAAAPSPAAVGEGTRGVAARSGAFRKEGLVKDIWYSFSVLQTYIEGQSTAGFYDCNVFAQGFMAGLLNIVFDWHLVDLNYLHKNQPGIDLGDPDSGMAVQVTAEKGSAKIQGTIDVFIEHGLYKQYPHLYFFILTGKQRRYQKPFNTRGCFSFDASKHILDFSGLSRNIEPKPVEEIEEIATFLAQQMRALPESGPANVSVLQELLDELPTVETLGFNDNQFQTWHARVKQALRRIFGENSSEVKEYAAIAWHTSDDPTRAAEQQDLYSRSCGSARAHLQAWVSNAGRLGQPSPLIGGIPCSAS